MWRGTCSASSTRPQGWEQLDAVDSEAEFLNRVLMSKSCLHSLHVFIRFEEIEGGVFSHTFRDTARS